jgi:hypothetical protein
VYATEASGRQGSLHYEEKLSTFKLLDPLFILPDDLLPALHPLVAYLTHPKTHLHKVS